MTWGLWITLLSSELYLTKSSFTELSVFEEVENIKKKSYRNDNSWEKNSQDVCACELTPMYYQYTCIYTDKSPTAPNNLLLPTPLTRGILKGIKIW